MSTPRFLFDEDFRRDIIQTVRRSEPLIETATVTELGLMSQPDETILQFAWEHDWLVVSHDVNTLIWSGSVAEEWSDLVLYLPL